VHTFPEAAGHECYLLHCCSNSNTTLAVAAHCPGNEIKLYDKNTLGLTADLVGHAAVVNDLQFAPDQNQLVSAASDGSVKIWDIRSRTVAQEFRGGDELWSSSVSVDGLTLCAGSEAVVYLWDRRVVDHPRLILDEVHTESVTQVRFHPVHRQMLVTGSVDGLVCLLNSDSPNADDALTSVLNGDVSVARVGFFGPALEHVYTTTHIEGLNCWSLGTEDLLGTVPDARPAITSTAPVNYLVDCHWSEELGALIVVAGDDDGAMSLGRVMGSSITPLGAVAGGHSGLIRGIDWKGGMLFSVGEDSRIVNWTWDPTQGLGPKAAVDAPAPAAAKEPRVRKSTTPSTSPYSRPK